METERKKGRFTFRSAAVLLIASGMLELLAVTSEVPLFGAIQGGIAAAVYHVVYAALFLALGWGLWNATQWGYRLVFITAAIYTLDKLQLVLSRQAMESFLEIQLAGIESQMQAQGLDQALIVQAVVLMAVMVVLGWWGFALYTYWRRDYFRRDAS